PRATQSGSMNVHCRPLVLIVWNRTARDMPPAARPGAASDETERHLRKRRARGPGVTAGVDARRATRRAVGATASPRPKSVSAAADSGRLIDAKPAARNECRSANQMRACPIFLQVSDETERHDAMRRGWCERRCCNGRTARLESAGLAGMLSGSLRQTYLSEIWMSNFFSFNQTKFLTMPGDRHEIGLNFREIFP
ncbi:hypothetical protein, partial [Burkholderia sp. LMG 13014]|uniref:hypothetical protein n=1 Tax=Burkholderia sp. LMG 13014 TaxID=2709306 RepID=UPI001966A2CC